MKDRAPRVLLVESAQGDTTPIAEELRKQGCECQFAKSRREALRRVERQQFDLVLSQMTLPDGSAYPLLAQLASTKASLFFSCPVARGCWWLPGLENGELRWGDPAMRPAEFALVLEQMVAEIHNRKQQATPIEAETEGSAAALTKRVAS